LFVELDETGADGFIPARTIGDEYFRFDEAGRAFVGHSVTHRLGDPVTVELVEAAPVAGALRFKLVGHDRAAAQRTGHKPPTRPKFAHRQKSRGRRR
jgi:ribonuclease R